MISYTTVARRTDAARAAAVADPVFRGVPSGSPGVSVRVEDPDGGLQIAVEHPIRGGESVYFAGLHGNSSHEGVSFTDTGICMAPDASSTVNSQRFKSRSFKGRGSNSRVVAWFESSELPGSGPCFPDSNSRELAASEGYRKLPGWDSLRSTFAPCLRRRRRLSRRLSLPGVSRRLSRGVSRRLRRL